MKSFMAYLDGDGAASLLAEIELNAAATAFANLRIIIDQRSQLWNAVNHLETSWQAELSRIRQGSRFWQRAVTVNLLRLQRMANRAKLIGYFLALCYKLLGEQNLVDECLRQLKVLDRVGYIDYFPGVKDMFLVFMTTVQLPVAAVAGATFRQNKYISPEQANEMEKILKSDWSSR
jgi:hypothetical protein